MSDSAMTIEELRAKRSAYQCLWVAKNKEKVSAWRKAIREGPQRERLLQKKRDSYALNKEKVLKYQAEYRANNKELVSLRNREYKQRDPALTKQRRSEEYIRNKERYREAGKRFKLNNPGWGRGNYAKNKDRINAKRRVKVREKMANNPSFRAAASMRSRVWSILTKGSIPRTGSIGLRQAALKEWLEAKFEPGMTWDNYGKGWHVDHIIPCTAFDLTKPSELRKCFHYHNLRPCWAEENIRKGDKVLTQSELEFAA